MTMHEPTIANSNLVVVDDGVGGAISKDIDSAAENKWANTRNLSLKRGTIINDFSYGV